MLFNDHLEEIIFHRHESHETEELVIISGYLGPSPVKRLSDLPFKCKVIYGMYGEAGIGEKLHGALVNIHETIDNVDIYYSTIPVHSKCYMWKKEGKTSHALIGSANFSTNGLCTPYREVLAETTYDTFLPLDQYAKKILENAISCTELELESSNDTLKKEIFISSDICKISLLDRSGEVQNAHGLNWGQGKGNTRPNDACLVIRTVHLDTFPNLFPPIQDYAPALEDGGKKQRKNDKVEIIWDDGTTMDGLLEGSVERNGIKYPKNFSSFPNKDIIGKYIRERIGVDLDERVTKEDLESYGRTDIEISLQSEGVYYFDFSVKK